MKHALVLLMRLRSILRSYVAPHFTPEKIRFYCSVFLVVNVLLVAARFATTSEGQSAFGYPLARDYTAFYVAGKIAHEQSFLSVYDFELQTKEYHELLPKEPADAQLPYVNPPFVLIPLSLLSRLPYAWAFGFWLVISLGLYSAGLGLLLRTSTRLPRYAQRTALSLGLAFAPFLLYCWGLGQLSSIGVFCLSLAIYLERKNRPALCGLALSLCLYKPPLLVLILPMLILSGRFRALAGLLTGSIMLTATSAWLVGWRGLLSYASTLYNFQRWKASASTISQTSLYVDVSTAFKLFIDAHPSSQLLVLTVYFAGILLLVWAWWRIKQHSLSWAVTITWSLVLNVYTPLYDAALLVIPAILITDHLYGIERKSLPDLFKAFIALLYLVPLCYVFLANRWGFQVFTILIIGFGLYQLRLLGMRNRVVNELQFDRP